MAQGEHTHEWLYNQAKEGQIDVKLRTISFHVIRFCKSCLKVEELKLQDLVIK